MPQFDFTTYSAQIFWFSLCFFVLYYFMSQIILPRIRNIISERKNIVDGDISSAKSTNIQSDAIKSDADEILLKADLQYRAALDEAFKNAAKNKEKFLEDFKIKSEGMIENSQNEIAKMIKNSENSSKELTDLVAKLTQNKIFNS